MKNIHVLPKLEVWEPKQETLEEAAHKALIDYGIKYKGEKLNISEVEKLMVSMAKWQQERSYSEEDLRTAWNSSAQNMRFTFSSSAYRNISFEQWFEQFKNE
jgi:hypothetical protein